MLVNLKELDLSFNYIERIQNLDKLTKLEVLSLFNNKIELIENIDTLENLVILSIGNNEINTLQGVSWYIALIYLIYTCSFPKHDLDITKRPPIPSFATFLFSPNFL